MDRLEQIDTFTRFAQVSRETILSLIKYEKILISENKKLNLVGKSTENQIWIRHFLYSAQVIDFIDKNEKCIVDLGSGAGFPGLILSIILKDRKLDTKVQLIEKSRKKSIFLKKAIRLLDFKSEVFNINIMEDSFYYNN